MKRIVILCDGTWNRSDSETPTNVVRFAQVLRSIDHVGIVQVPIYIQGVGTGRGSSWFSRTSDTLLGGGLGWGLMDNLEEAYRHLVFLYEPSDEIHILGFSRGAYTARSLAGFIRSTGIIGRDALHRLPEAIARYRTMDDETTHPSSEESHAFRADISPHVVTSAAELAWRATHHPAQPTPHLLEVSYLGVWDSVGALGIPAHVPVLGRITARKYRFHDASLSSMVKSARHAVALDERRRTFPPTRWDNIAKLNAGHAGTLPYQELFFAGDHGSIGGGGDITALSSIGLRWIVEGAQDAGLVFDVSHLERIREEEDPMGPLNNTSKKPGGVFNYLMTRNAVDRQGPTRMEELHPSVLTRWAFETKDMTFEPYRPGSLERVQTELAAYHEQSVYGETDRTVTT